jgi:hypothetical protein
LLALVVLNREPVQTLPVPPEQKLTITGTLSGRASKKPLAKASICLARLTQDDEGRDAKLTLTEFSAATDDQGNFQLKGAPAGTYTLVYRPAPSALLKAGTNIPVLRLSNAIRSFLPLLRNREVGLTEPFAERPWTPEFTLMKGHTLFCVPLGSQMTIWNASVRSRRQGPFLEMRRNRIWRQDFQKDMQLKFEAWSF